jgi:hypothetical protein
MRSMAWTLAAKHARLLPFRVQAEVGSCSMAVVMSFANAFHSIMMAVILDMLSKMMLMYWACRMNVLLCRVLEGYPAR